MDEDDNRPPARQSPLFLDASRPLFPATTVVTPQMAANVEIGRRHARLNARLKSRGLPITDLPDPPTGMPAQLTEAARERLSVFSTGDIGDCRRTLGPVHSAVWPSLEGCLGVVFTSRAGSTYLARELAVRRRIGRMEEALNPHVVQGLAAADIIRSWADGWFSFKLGVRGMITTELCGVASRYLENMYFVFLRRRDIVAQAVSLVKANQTGRWHSFHTAAAEPLYDAALIAGSVRNIASSVASLRRYLQLTKRPWRPLYYEDFEHGDFTSAEAICDEFGIPRAVPGMEPKFVPLHRTADTVNAEWITRFKSDMDPNTRAVLHQYAAEL